MISGKTIPQNLRDEDTQDGNELGVDEKDKIIQYMSEHWSNQDISSQYKIFLKDCTDNYCLQKLLFLYWYTYSRRSARS